MKTIPLRLPVTGMADAGQVQVPRGPGGGLWARWRRAWRARQFRRSLLEMDDRMLSDIGVSRAQALFELDR